MEIKLLADRVMVKVVSEERTAGGIIIPDTVKEKPSRGKVVAVGPGIKDEPMSLTVGNTVLFGKYGSQEIDLDGEKYLIMRQRDVIAVLN